MLQRFLINSFETVGTNNTHYYRIRFFAAFLFGLWVDHEPLRLQFFGVLLDFAGAQFQLQLARVCLRGIEHI